MYKKLIIVFIFLFNIIIIGQPLVELDSLSIHGTSGISKWGDFDNDSDLDIFVAGLNSDSNTLHLYENLGNNTFSEKVIPDFVGVSSGCDISIGDLNNDGFIDLLVSGSSDQTNNAKIYKNLAGVGFELTNVSLPALKNASSDLGDYDNDGDLDIVLVGDYASAVYKNEGDFLFYKQSSINLLMVQQGEVHWFDYNEDKNLDILISGYNGAIASSTIYKNNGDNTFSKDDNIPLSGLQLGDLDLGDYNNDGHIDILMSGRVGGNNSKTLIYQNNGNGNFSEVTNTDFVQSYIGSVCWGDYDNDGLLDFVVSGYTPNGKITYIYKNNNNNSFSKIDSLEITGVSESSTRWGDYDGDGDLDLLLNGDDGTNQILKIYQNNTTVSNTAPSTPDNLNYIVENQNVTFSWNKSTDNESGNSGISYNVYLHNSERDYSISPMANLTSGKRYVVEIGNAGFDNTLSIKNLDPGSYHFAVQAIDNSFRSSQFSIVGYFEVFNGTIQIQSPNGGEVWEAGSLQEVKWFSSGLSNPIIFAYSTDDKATWNEVYWASSTNESSYLWEVPNLPSTKCYIKIKNAVDSSIFDISDAAFTIEEATGINTSEESPLAFELKQNYPNPFNPTTNIKFSIPEAGFVKLVIYDLLGNEIRHLINSNMNAGNHEISFNAKSLASGIYVYKLSVDNKFFSTKKMTVLK